MEDQLSVVWLSALPAFVFVIACCNLKNCTIMQFGVNRKCSHVLLPAQG